MLVNMKNFFLKFSNKTIKYIFIFFLIIFSLSSIISTCYLIFGGPGGTYLIIYEFGFNIVNTILIISFLFIIYYLNKNKFFHIKEKYLLLIEICIFTVIGLLIVFSHANAYLQSDSGNVMDAAIQVYNGDYTALDFKSYMNANPNNFGLFTIDYLLLKIFSSQTVVVSAFRLINLISVILLYFYLYKMTDLLFENYLVNMNVIVLFMGFTQLLFISSFVYGNAISYSASIISVYYLLKYFKHNRIEHVILSIVLISLSVFVRRNSLIVFIAEMIFLVLYMIKAKRNTLLYIVLSGLLVFASTKGVEKYYGNLVNYDYSKTAMPTITWIAYGLNHDEATPGRWFSEYDQIHVANNFETDLIKVEAKQFIDTTLETFANNPKLAIKFFATKFASSWTDPRYDAFSYSYHSLHPLVANKSFEDAFTCYWDSCQTILSIGLIILLIKRFEFKLEHLLPALCVIGGFLFHSFWEVKALYCYQYVLFLLPYAALGLSKITQFSKQ